MTTTASGRKATAACNGVTTAFAVPFQVQAASDLLVYLLDDADADNADGTLLSEGSDYTISGDLSAGTGIVTTLTAYASGKYLRRWRQTDRAQEARYVPGDDFSAAGTESAMDRLALVDEEIADDLASLDERAVQVPAGADPLVIDVAGGGGLFLGLSADETEFVWLSGTGNDADLRTDLAGADGDLLLRFTPGGTAPASRTVQAKLREQVSTLDKGTDLRASLVAIATDFGDNGGKAFIPKYGGGMTAGFTFTGQRMHLCGEGANVSRIGFNPASTDAAITFNAGTSGGTEQASVKGVGFNSANSVDKTAIKFVNVANCLIEDIGISTGSWLGSGSIGIHCYGRQLVEINRATIGCARPLVFSQNATFTSLSTDHFLIENSELIGTSAVKAVIEFEDGVSFAQTKIWNTAVVGGQDGILWNDTGSTAASFNLDIRNVRTEQGLDAAAYAIRLESTAQNLQNVTIAGNQLGSDRNGVKLRKAQRVTIVDTVFNTSGKTALDMTFVAGSSLRLDNCSGAGTFTLTNARCVYRLADSRALGMNELWVYDANDSSGALQFDVPLGGVPFTLANNAVGVLTDDTMAGWIDIVTTEDVGAIFFLRGGSHSVSERDDPDGYFSGTKDTGSSVNVYWDAGSSAYVLQNKRGSSVTFSALRRGSNIGA